MMTADVIVDAICGRAETMIASRMAKRKLSLSMRLPRLLRSK